MKAAPRLSGDINRVDCTSFSLERVLIKFILKIMFKLKKGFTLIELLVVIAIIGILSSVVLASLNSARGKGNDAKVKAQLAGFRAAAEIYYDTAGQKYQTSGAAVSNSCATANTVFNDTYSGGTVANSGAASYTAAANYPTGATLMCNVTATGSAYAFGALLPGAGGTNSWCVDSKGASKSEGTLLASGTTQCP